MKETIDIVFPLRICSINGDIWHLHMGNSICNGGQWLLKPHLGALEV